MLEILKHFSPSYRAQRREENEARVDKMLNGKDLNFPVNISVGGRDYLGARIRGIHRGKLLFEGNGYVMSTGIKVDFDFNRVHTFPQVRTFSGPQTVSVEKVRDIRQSRRI